MAQPEDFCPYKGLLPYTDEDRDYFFGREEDQETISANLVTTGLTIFYGASGVGKSSVLLAGVVPFLRTLPDVTVVVFRAWQDRTFLSALKAEIARAVAARTGRVLTSDEPLDEFLAKAARAARCTLAIIFDQFEEYFLNHPLGEIGNTFDAEFARAVNRDDIDANFLLSLREDGLALLDRFQGRIPNLLRNLLRLEHLDREAAIRAIRTPLDRYNELRAAPGAHITIEDALVEALVEEVRTGRVTIGQVGQGQLREDDEVQGARAADHVRIETPFLQMVLTRLWDEEMAAGSRILRLSTFVRLGRAQEIVRTHLDGVMDELNATERAVCALFFDRLVTPSGNKIAYTVDDLKEWAGSIDTYVPSVLKTLSDKRILRGVTAVPGQPAALRYEIFHDVLAPAILDWKARFEHTQKLEEAKNQQAAEAERQREELARAQALAVEQERRAEAEQQRAEEQQRRAEEQTRAARRLKQLSFMLAVVFLLAMGVGWYAAHTREQEKKAQTRERQSSSRELARLARSNSNRDPECSIALAWHAASKTYALDKMVTSEAEAALHWAEQIPQVRLTLLGQPKTVRHMAFSPDGTYLATASLDETGKVSTVKVWEVASGKELRTLPSHAIPVIGIAFSRNGKYLAIASQEEQQEGTVKVWEVPSDQEPRSLPGHAGTVYGMAFSPNGNQLAIASQEEQQEGTVKVWEVPSDQEPRSLPGHAGTVYGMAFSPNGNQLAIASQEEQQEGIVKIWEVTSDQQPRILRGHTGIVYDVAFSPDGERLATASADKTVRVWELASRQEMRTLVGHTNSVFRVAFSPDGERLTTASADKTVRVWELASLQELWTLGGHTNQGIEIAFPNGNQLVTASLDGTMRVWELASRQEMRTLVGLINEADEMGFSPDGTYLATVSKDEPEKVWTVKVWEVASGKELRTLPGQASPIIGIAFSPDGTYLSTVRAEGTVKVWEVASSKELRTLPGQASPIIGIAFSPDGKYLATVSAEGTVKVWEVASGKELRTLPSHIDSFIEIALGPDGTHLATATIDGTVKVWEIASGKELRTLTSHTDPVITIAFSRNGSYLATVSVEGIVKVWEVASGKEPRTLLSHTSPVIGIAFSADGTHLTTSSLEKRIEHPLKIEDLMQRVKNRFSGKLPPEDCANDRRGDSHP